MRGRIALWLGMVLLALAPLMGGPMEAALRPGDEMPIPTEPLPPAVVAEQVVPNTGGFVVAMAFAPDGRLFYTSKGGFQGDGIGEVYIIENGLLRADPFLRTPVDANGERGLVGIAFDPDYWRNRYVYIYKTAPASETGTGRPINRIIRYVEDPITQQAIPDSATILFEVPIGEENDPNTNHVGGNLRFGPDGKLYVSIGDFGRNPSNAQTLSNRMGKIHRLNPDGSMPEDNPFSSDSRESAWSIWSYGHRNSFGFAFDPVSQAMFFTENGPACDDEVNLGVRGGNYGWPHSCGQVPTGTIPPLFRFTEPIGIGQIDFYTGSILPWDGSPFWCGINTGKLYRGTLDEQRTALTAVTTIEGAPPCATALVDGPDGALYLASANTISRIRPLPYATLLPLVVR